MVDWLVSFCIDVDVALRLQGMSTLHADSTESEKKKNKKTLSLWL